MNDFEFTFDLVFSVSVQTYDHANIIQPTDVYEDQNTLKRVCTLCRFTHWPMAVGYLLFGPGSSSGSMAHCTEHGTYNLQVRYWAVA